MTLIYIFILSGLALAVLLVSKRIEEKKRRPVFVLKIISKGDERVRELHHQMIRYYSVGKERIYVYVCKQLPRYSRSSLNKIIAKLEEGLGRYLDKMRDARLLKKTDGLSEFFRNISDVDKGTGEINENIYIGETEAIIEEQTTDNLQPAAVSVEEPVIITEANVRRPRKPRTRRIKVVSEEQTQEIL